ncbi:MAG: flagellar biosynthetic protein FliR [Rhodospirillales bacterium]|nr:flagellar biosynthetic protein FliR [Rhodospirillales bacterium]
MPSFPIAAEIFGLLLVFTRLGTAIAFLPGFSAVYVPVRLRLLLALLLSVLVAPALGGVLPPMPQSPAALALLLAGEATIGLFLATVVRIAFAALQIAGTAIAFLGSFANALVQDPVVDQQSSAVGGFFTTLGVVVVFAADLHLVMLRALVDSYATFLPQTGASLGDLAAATARAVADSFALGVQLAAPFVVVSLVYNVGMALLGRLVPQLQVFFFGLPIQLGLQIWVMMLTLSGIMLVFVAHFGRVLATVAGG